MDKGIENARKGSITFHTELGDVVLAPGRNRLSVQQFESIQKHPLFKVYTEPTEREENEYSTDKETGAQIVTKVKVNEHSYLKVLGDIPAVDAAPAPAPAAETKPKSGNLR